MKRIKLILMVALPLLLSCSEDGRYILNPDKFVPSEWNLLENGSLFEQGDEIVLKRDEAENMFASLSWSAADFGYSVAVTYNIEVARKTGQEDWLTVASLNDKTIDVTVKDLNTWLVNSGAEKGSTNTMLMRVAAMIGSNYTPIYSNAFEFKANVFSNDPDRLYFVSDKSASKLSGEWLLSPDFNGQYVGFAYIPDGADGIWLVEDTDVETRWGLSDSTEKGSKLTLVKESDGGRPIMPGAFGEGDVDASFTADGYYRIKVDFSAGTIEIWRFRGDFNIVGQRNMNYLWWANSMSKQMQSNKVDGKPWGTGAKLTYYPEERVWKTETVYVPKEQTDNVAVPAPGNGKTWEFKLRANDTWGPALEGGGSSDDAVDSDGVQSGEIGVKNIGGATGNIRFNAEEGWYHWEVYLGERPFRYRMVPDPAPAD
ncbi:MAG: SusE domain-containing protein [Candidatus Cryptobacteroides sp.]